MLRTVTDADVVRSIDNVVAHGVVESQLFALLVEVRDTEPRPQGHRARIRGLLSEQDARWIAQALKEGFPDAR